MRHVDAVVVIEYDPPYFSTPGLYVDTIKPRSMRRGRECNYLQGPTIRTTLSTYDVTFSRLVMFWRRECTT